MTLEQEFEKAMIQIYHRAKKDCGYNATRFLQMIERERGLGAARKLLRSPATSSGLTELYMHNRLDLTVEAHVISEKFRPLFTEEELRIAADRLRELGYQMAT